jgi:hypothetical protein
MRVKGDPWTRLLRLRALLGAPPLLTPTPTSAEAEEIRQSLGPTGPCRPVAVGAALVGELSVAIMRFAAVTYSIVSKYTFVSKCQQRPG